MNISDIGSPVKTRSQTESDLWTFCEVIHDRAAPLAGKGVLVVSSFGEDPDADHNKGIGSKIRRVRIGDVAETIKTIKALTRDRHRNVYMSIGVYRLDLETGLKGSETDLVGVLGFVADFDDSKAHRYAERLHPIEPSLVVESSSGRFQAFILLDQPATVEEAKPIAVRLKHFAGCDHCTMNCCQPWRVPGLLNWPNKKKVHQEGRSREPQTARIRSEFVGVVYSLADLDAILPQIPKKETVNGTANGHKFEFRAENRGDIPRFLLDHMDDPLPEGQRSERDWKVLTSLVELGFSDDRIVSEVMSRTSGVGSKFIGNEKRLRGEINRARAKARGLLSKDRWQRHERKTRDRATSSPAAKPASSSTSEIAGPFVVTEDGVYYTYTKDGEEVQEKICSRLDVIAITHDEQEEGWGRVLNFKDLGGTPHQWAMPMSLTAGDGLEIRQELLSQGLVIEAFKGAGVKVVQYIVSAHPSETWLSVSRIGWHGESFILPDETFGSADRPIVLQRERSAKHAFRTKGTLEEWQAKLSRYCVGNAYLAFAVSSAFTGPLLKPMNEQGGGFHYRGDSSCGKSTCLEVAGSVCGGGGQNGYKTTWRATDNGLEGVAEGHCDTLLCIDEIGESDAKTIGTTAYMLANGQGKIRASKIGTARPPAEWRLLFLSSGEESLASRVVTGGGKTQAGMEIRLADIPINGRWGVLNELHDFADYQEPGADQTSDRDRAKALINHLKRAAVEHYGIAIREYLRQLVQIDPIGLAEEIAREQADFYRRYVPADSGAQVGRVAKRFALVAAAGQIATDMGLTGWPDGEAMRAAGYCFTAWLGARGTTEDSENGTAVDQVRTFIEVHGASRFSSMNDAENGIEDARVINRAGYKRKTADGQTEYLIFRNVFRNEVCKGFDHTKVEELLIERNFLATSGGKRQIQVKRSAGYLDENGEPITNELGQLRTKERFYCILPAILTES
ncbi:DUF927 domain-containing protein (plasmid) [Skermanella rosea]|uniref:DUF927 domain-containing protein n=1 Tax=Skermanella rosea TaxID=1817965 RepID=UPI0019345209|nr:DUF927 domain-containing protein [Skermanella rosea]UEM08227.1 DUF927 domain-containing protein [Skermanella rosea]